MSGSRLLPWLPSTAHKAAGNCLWLHQQDCLTAVVLNCLQASAAVSRAHEAGVKRQKLELLLPQAGATSSQGSWPGGIRQQAQFAVPRLIEPLLKELKQQEAFQVSSVTRPNASVISISILPMQQ